MHKMENNFFLKSYPKLTWRQRNRWRIETVCFHHHLRRYHSIQTNKRAGAKWLSSTKMLKLQRMKLKASFVKMRAAWTKHIGLRTWVTTTSKVYTFLVVIYHHKRCILLSNPGIILLNSLTTSSRLLSWVRPGKWLNKKWNSTKKMTCLTVVKSWWADTNLLKNIKAAEEQRWWSLCKATRTGCPCRILN